MAIYTIPLNDYTEVTIYTAAGFQGIHASGHLTATHEDGSTEDYGHRDPLHYVDYCLTEVVAHEVIRIMGNYPSLSDDWNVWESLEGVLPDCECD